jgi:outer membrane protein OmpA-like peptidoglycan-associated protein
MTSLKRLLLIAPLALLLVSCANQKNIVVLLPDQDGRPSSVTVSNKGGAQVINVPNQVSSIDSAETRPTDPKPMEDKKIREVFGRALDAQPLKPVHFTLYFEFNSDNLTAESKIMLKRFLEESKTFKPSAVAIIGHTDLVGTSKVNYELGLERAVAVKKILVDSGIKSSIVEVTSHGKDNPLIKTADNVAEPRNRRVEAVMR